LGISEILQQVIARIVDVRVHLESGRLQAEQ
jgi:hypothetical protein